MISIAVTSFRACRSYGLGGLHGVRESLFPVVYVIDEGLRDKDFGFVEGQT